MYTIEEALHKVGAKEAIRYRRSFLSGEDWWRLS